MRLSARIIWRGLESSPLFIGCAQLAAFRYCDSCCSKVLKDSEGCLQKFFELGSGSIESGGKRPPGVTRRVEQGWTSRSREARLLAIVHLNVVLQESSLHQSIVWGNLVLTVRCFGC